jgi:hypothetical protein
VDALGACDGQVTLLLDFRLAIFIHVCLDYYNLRSGGI